MEPTKKETDDIVDNSIALHWHCEIAAMVLNQFPINPFTKQHVREAIRYATNSVNVKPRYASQEAIELIKTNCKKDCIKEHAIPVSLVIGKVMDRARPILLFKEGKHDFLRPDQSSQWRFAKTTSESERAFAMGNIRAWEIADLIKEWSVTAWVTKSEDERLRKHKLHNRMPSGWDGENLLARYQACGIECLEIRQTSS